MRPTFSNRKFTHRRGRLRRRLAVGSMAVLIIGGAQQAVMPSANAGTPDCPFTSLCMWTDKNFEGGMDKWDARHLSYGCHNIQRKFQNQISSFHNNSGQRISFHRRANCGWVALPDVAGRENVPNLGSPVYKPLNVNDKFISFEVKRPRF